VWRRDQRLAPARRAGVPTPPYEPVGRDRGEGIDSGVNGASGAYGEAQGMESPRSGIPTLNYSVSWFSGRRASQRIPTYAGVPAPRARTANAPLTKLPQWFRRGTQNPLTPNCLCPILRDSESRDSALARIPTPRSPRDSGRRVFRRAVGTRMPEALFFRPEATVFPCIFRRFRAFLGGCRRF